MKRFFSALEAALPHVVIDMSVCFLIFLILNRYNPLMAFLSNKYSQILLVVFCVTSFIESILLIRDHRK